MIITVTVVIIMIAELMRRAVHWACFAFHPFSLPIHFSFADMQFFVLNGPIFVAYNPIENVIIFEELIDEWHLSAYTHVSIVLFSILCDFCFLFHRAAAFMACSMALKTCPNQFQISWHVKMCGSWYLELMILWPIVTTCQMSHILAQHANVRTLFSSSGALMFSWHCPRHCSTNVHSISIKNYFPSSTEFTSLQNAYLEWIRWFIGHLVMSFYFVRRGEKKA